MFDKYEEFLKALHPQYQEVNENKTRGLNRLRSKGYGSYDPKAFNVFLKDIKQSKKGELIEYHWNPNRLINNFKKTSHSASDKYSVGGPTSIEERSRTPLANIAESEQLIVKKSSRDDDVKSDDVVVHTKSTVSDHYNVYSPSEGDQSISPAYKKGEKRSDVSYYANSKLHCEWCKCVVL